MLRHVMARLWLMKKELHDKIIAIMMGLWLLDNYTCIYKFLLRHVMAITVCVGNRGSNLTCLFSQSKAKKVFLTLWGMAIFARVGLVSNFIKAVLQIQWRTLRSGVALQWDKGARRSLLNWRRVMYARSTPVLMCHWISATWLFLREAARRISQEEWWDVQGENQLLCGRPFIL